MSRLTQKLGRLKTTAAIAGITVAAVVATAIPGIALTNASWQDTEWANGALGVQNCATATGYTSRGAGALVGGTLLGTDLAAAASLKDVTVTNDGTASVADPATASAQGSDAYVNPLDVSALGAINLSLGSLLQLPVGTGAGVVNQYGQAQGNGKSAGAAGVVSNSGGIGLTVAPPGPGLPTFATLDLATVLSSLGLNGTANLTDLTLQLGAVASSATLDACNAQWTKNLYANLARNYVAAGLSASVDTPLVGNLTTTVSSTVTTLQNSLNALAGNGGLLNSLGSGLLGALAPILGTLGLGTPTTTLAVQSDFSSVTGLLTSHVSDPAGIVDIDLGAGTITVNVAALFDGTHGLNGQAPNTQLLINAQVINNLVGAITTALTAWVNSVTAALTTALSALTVTVDVTAPVLGGNLGTVDIGVQHVSLASLSGGSAPVAATFTPGSDCSVIVLNLICGLAGGLVSAVSGVSSGLVGPALGLVLSPAIALITGGTLVTGLGTTLTAITAPLVTLLGSSLTGLFGENSLLSIVINAQNAPDPAGPGTANPLPGWAGALPIATTAPYSTGQYDVSALRIVILGAVGSGVAVDLARSSVGANAPAP